MTDVDSSSSISGPEDALNEVRVRKVLENYLYWLDRDDFGPLAACFTKEAACTYDLNTTTADRVNVPKPYTFVGGRAVADWIEAAHARRRSITTHTLSNLHISVSQGTAEASSHVIATMAARVDVGYSIRVRGIRYDDQLIETEAGWRISRRDHSQLWQYDVVSDDAPAYGAIGGDEPLRIAGKIFEG